MSRLRVLPQVGRLLRRRARLVLTLLVVAALVVAGATLVRSLLDEPAGLDLQAVESLTLETVPEPDGSPVTLDVDVYRPTGAAAYPAVLLAHGFGGSKASVAGQARSIAAEGYVVASWSARGFGASGGRIHLDDPELEIADVSTVIDAVAARADVVKDGDDPRVAVAGASYGGAAALMAAAADDRVDSVVAAITWHDLADAFFPQAGSGEGASEVGPLKATWASTFFTSVVAASLQGGGAAQGDPRCGRFDATVCALFLEAADTGEPSEELITLLRAHSPAAVLDDVDVPVYLVQGMADSLFGIEHAQATAEVLRGRGVPVSVRWFDGGHDGVGPTGLGGSAAAPVTGGADSPSSADDTGDEGLVSNRAADAVSAETEQQDAALHAWLAGTLGDAHTPPAQASPLPAFTWTEPRAPRENRATVRELTAAGDLEGSAGETVLPLSGGGVLLAPPGGTPAAVSSLPGGGALAAGLASYRLAALPTQHVALDTPDLTQAVDVVGSPRVRLEVTSTAPETTLFVSLWQLPGEGRAPTAQRSLVAPVRVATTPGRPTQVEVALPAATYSAPAGARWRVLVSATDSAFRNGTEAAQISAAPVEADRGLVLPTLEGQAVGGPNPFDGQTIALLVALGGLWSGLGVLWLVGRRGRIDSSGGATRPDLADVPLAVEGLVKEYPDGHRAVDDVSWRALPGQVVGLLGPNGAGKTTTLRMVLGLISPDQGEVYLLGERVRPGADVLRRVGALVEGPGFLPHLTGRANLDAYWAATGRPREEARMEEALAVAALGTAVDRPVRSYSQGMRQRLGIAQAMLGMPEVLILDEPTNGLDPPQIAGLRPILHRYAEAGRCVVVSSHLLAEVQQTCTHVVVMDAGRVLAAGSVEEVGVSTDRSLEEVFLSTIGTGRHDDATDEATRTEHLRQVRPR